MGGAVDDTLVYYDRRAGEYDATSWEHPGEEPHAVSQVSAVLGSLEPARTLDVGCGTGFVSRWLPGSLTLLDSSLAMLGIARRRLPARPAVRAKAPWMPFVDGAFERAFAANLYGHLRETERAALVGEMRRVASEVVLVEQLSLDGAFAEGLETRPLLDGETYTIYKCYFTVDRLLAELGGGTVLMDGPVFAVVRRAA